MYGDVRRCHTRRRANATIYHATRHPTEFRKCRFEPVRAASPVVTIYDRSNGFNHRARSCSFIPKLKARETANEGRRDGENESLRGRGRRLTSLLLSELPNSRTPEFARAHPHRQPDKNTAFARNPLVLLRARMRDVVDAGRQNRRSSQDRRRTNPPDDT